MGERRKNRHSSRVPSTSTGVSALRSRRTSLNAALQKNHPICFVGATVPDPSASGAPADEYLLGRIPHD